MNQEERKEKMEEFNAKMKDATDTVVIVGMEAKDKLY